MSFERILVCLDGSDFSERVLPTTIAIARAFGSNVTLLHVVEPPFAPHHRQPVDALALELNRAESQRYLDRIVAALAPDGLKVDSRILHGAAADQVRWHARQQGSDLVSVSTHGEKNIAWALSSTAQKLVSDPPSSLLIVPSRAPVQSKRLQRVMVPLDASRRAESAVPAAIRLARHNEAELLLVHLVATPEISTSGPLTPSDQELVSEFQRRNVALAQSYLSDLQQRVSHPGVIVTTVLEATDDVAQGLADIAGQRDVSLIMLSAHGRTCNPGVPHGNVTQKLIARARCPLLVHLDVERVSTGATKQWPSDVLVGLDLHGRK